jgi:hypothetical protein
MVPSFGKFDARQNGLMNGDNFLIASLSSTTFAMITPTAMRITALIK